MLKNNVDEFDALLRQQPDITNSLRGAFGRTLLMEGARYGDTQIVSLLSNREHDLSVVVDVGLNVLRWIVWNNDDVSLELFNSLDATQLTSDVINQQNIYNETALHIAAYNNMHKSIVWLLDHGADRSIKDGYGQRPGEQPLCDDETRRLIESFRK